MQIPQLTPDEIEKEYYRRRADRPGSILKMWRQDWVKEGDQSPKPFPMSPEAIGLPGQVEPNVFKGSLKSVSRIRRELVLSTSEPTVPETILMLDNLPPATLEPGATIYYTGAELTYTTNPFKAAVTHARLLYYPGENLPPKEVLRNHEEWILIVRGGDLMRLGDTKTAVALWRTVADQGSVQAEAHLGLHYKVGDPKSGILPNYNEALSWYRRAAQHGDLASQFAAGEMYLFGLGTPKDYVQAYEWFDVASATAFPPFTEGARIATKAAEIRECISQLMPGDQIFQAQELASKWKSVPKQAVGYFNPRAETLTLSWNCRGDAGHK